MPEVAPKFYPSGSPVSAMSRVGGQPFIIGAAAALCLWAVPSTIAQKGEQKSGRKDAGKAAPGKAPRDYPVKPVPFTAVHFNDVFWAPRIETNRTVTIPFAFQKCDETKRIYNFERAAAALRGEQLQDKRPPGYPFDDTDPYKVLEGASYTLSVHPDAKLEAYLDNLIAKIGSDPHPHYEPFGWHHWPEHPWFAYQFRRGLGETQEALV